MLRPFHGWIRCFVQPFKRLFHFSLLLHNTADHGFLDVECSARGTNLIGVQLLDSAYLAEGYVITNQPNSSVHQGLTSLRITLGNMLVFVKLLLDVRSLFNTYEFWSSIDRDYNTCKSMPLTFVTALSVISLSVDKGKEDRSASEASSTETPDIFRYRRPALISLSIPSPFTRHRP